MTPMISANTVNANNSTFNNAGGNITTRYYGPDTSTHHHNNINVRGAGHSVVGSIHGDSNTVGQKATLDTPVQPQSGSTGSATQRVPVPSRAATSPSKLVSNTHLTVDGHNHRVVGEVNGDKNVIFAADAERDNHNKNIDHNTPAPPTATPASPNVPAVPEDPGRESMPTTIRLPSGGIIDLTTLDKAHERPLITISRRDRSPSLYRLTQKKKQYGIFNNIPWVFLLFHLESGGSKKTCTAVEIKGKFLNKEVVEIRDMWPKKNPNKLEEYPTTAITTVQKQLQVGFNPKFQMLFLLGHTDSVAHTGTTGQKLLPLFGVKEFSVSLSIAKGSPKGISTADFVEFGILMELEKEGSSTTIELDAAVTYASSGIFGGTTEKTIRNSECRVVL